MIRNFFRFLLSNINYFWSVFFFALAVSLSCLLVSYNIKDSSMNKAGNNVTTNLLGEVGAYIADPLLQLFGAANIIIIIVFFVWSVIYFTEEHIKLLWLRFISLLISLFSGALLLNFLQYKHYIYFIFGLGGIVGKIIYAVSMDFLSKQNIIILYLVLNIVSTYFALAINWRNWIFIFKKILNAFYAVLKMIYYIFKKILHKEATNNIIENDVPEKKNKSSIFSNLKPTKNKNIKAPIVKKNTNIDGYQLPSFSLLNEVVVNKEKNIMTPSVIAKNKEELIQTLKDFGIKGDIVNVYTGPVVTLYEFEPIAGTKSARIIGLSDDIARSMKAHSARIAVVPGENALGIELPNKKRETIYLRDMLESKVYNEKNHNLPIILGKDISGNPIVADLSKMPHLLVAGTTGSGKSVSINTMLLSLLYSLSPKKCKLLLVDPKMLELSVYDGIPHLITPVVTEPKKAVAALKWVVKEMEERYRLISNLGVRNIAGYNEKIVEANNKQITLYRSIQTGFDRESGKPIIEKIAIDMNELPYIVVIVDEMADLMLVAGKEIETSIQRLSQMARAAGIHLVMATQRPSVDVITGVIKANFPTRISFHVTSRIDSRTILGEQGAEQLLGMGDLLYMGNGSKIVRIHGPYVADDEVRNVVAFLKTQGQPEYIENVTLDDEDSQSDISMSDGVDDEMYQKALEIVVRDKKASTSYIQRCLRIGYNRAATIIEKLEKNGVVSEANHVGKREVLL
jgi:DNA segregation ATPase FtsK/SpoIIIE, S-DNA-T family